jgi:cell filamentation protein
LRSEETLTLYQYQVEQDCYCYKGTGVLKNRAGIRDPALLEQFELELTTLRADEPLPQGNFDVRHYRAVHHHIFQDVYSWAGKFRTVRTGKGGNWFCYPENISAALVPVFASLQSPTFLPGAPAEDFVSHFVKAMGDLSWPYWI